MLKSPIYRTGSKEKNMIKLQKIIPTEINNFYDVFGGSGIVGMNSFAKNVYYNELDPVTFKMIEYLKNTDNDLILKTYYDYKNKNFNGNARNFYKFVKNDYNTNFEINKLWYLSFMCFSNKIVLTRDNKMSNTYGKCSSEEKLNNIDNFKDIHISNLDAIEFITARCNTTKCDLWFFDPPYL